MQRARRERLPAGGDGTTLCCPGSCTALRAPNSVLTASASCRNAAAITAGLPAAGPARRAAAAVPATAKRWPNMAGPNSLRIAIEKSTPSPTPPLPSTQALGLSRAPSGPPPPPPSARPRRRRLGRPPPRSARCAPRHALGSCHPTLDDASAAQRRTAGVGWLTDTRTLPRPPAEPAGVWRDARPRFRSLARARLRCRLRPGLWRRQHAGLWGGARQRLWRQARVWRLWRHGGQPLWRL